MAVLRMIYTRFLNEHGSACTVGGIQTYLRDLALCAAELDFRPVLYQLATRPFNKVLSPLEVKGVVVDSLSPTRKNLELLYKCVTNDIDDDSDIVLFGSDAIVVKGRYPRAMAIQHGISWDKPEVGAGRWDGLNVVPFVKRIRISARHWRHIKDFEACRNRVCVDYNFQNWYRTFRQSGTAGRTWVIPNYTPVLGRDFVDRKISKPKSTVRVLFARRFEVYRGTTLMADAVASVLAALSNVQFTFAGEGPEKSRLVEKFGRCPQVSIKEVAWDDRMAVVGEHDIAVVPSTGSEGTSLALAEAMGAGCAVIATDVGGMTSMVIDGFNGLIVPPKVEQLTEAIVACVKDQTLRQRLARNAYAVACDGFSIGEWRRRWKMVFNEIRLQ